MTVSLSSRADFGGDAMPESGSSWATEGLGCVRAQGRRRVTAARLAPFAAGGAKTECLGRR